jgi:hypothetical protein
MNRPDSSAVDGGRALDQVPVTGDKPDWPHKALLAAAITIMGHTGKDHDEKDNSAWAAAWPRAWGSASRAAQAQTKVAIGISGWTGFAPLTLAKEAGIFAKNGLDVTIQKIPQASRHLAIASGAIQCAATTVETWIVWDQAGVKTKQLFQLDKSYGADGMAGAQQHASIKDLKGKTVAASSPGTAPYFTLAWFLRENGMTPEGREHRQHGARPGSAGLRRRPERCRHDL